MDYFSLEFALFTFFVVTLQKVCAERATAKKHVNMTCCSDGSVQTVLECRLFNVPARQKAHSKESYLLKPISK